MKSKRQEAILALIRSRSIYTQEELSRALAEAGFPNTQATISRDIRELRLTKESSASGARYAASEDVAARTPFERVFRDALLSADYAGNMLVLRTLSGMAMAVAAALDAMDIPDILGSVAGDDAIICVVKTEAAAAKLVERFSS